MRQKPRKAIPKNPEMNRDRFLACVPEGAVRVRVITDRGIMKYRKIDEVADTDRVQTDRAGAPVVMKVGPGRPTGPAPAKNQPLPASEVTAELMRRKGIALGEDLILKATRESPESPDVLQQVILGLGEEAASLAFERQEADRQGKDSSGHSTRRVQALRAMGDTWLKRMDQVVARTVDMESAGFKILFKFIMDTFRESMNASNMRPEQVETVFAKFSSMIDDAWQAEAKNRMKRPG